jgi:DNA primase
MRSVDFREARQRVRIVEVLDLMSYQPRRLLGVQGRGPCPLHRSRSATSRAFAVHLSKNVYHCFVCGASGNALDLWAAWTRQSLYPAVLDLYRRLGREVPLLGSCRAASGAAWSVGAEQNPEETDPMPDP